jgi:hypothetical protein
MQNAAATPRFFMFVVRRRAVPCLHANESAGNTYNNAMELEQVLKACGDGRPVLFSSRPMPFRIWIADAAARNHALQRHGVGTLRRTGRRV